MKPENGHTAEILFYTPAEFKALLERASKQPAKAEQDFRDLLPMLAIGGLAGLRTQEMLRLTWEDTRRVENHIEVTSGKAKTRQRRLVEVVPALAQWLAPYSEREGKLWAQHEVTFQQHFVDLCAQVQTEVKGKKVAVARKQNGLRHSFCTYHFAAHGNENLTAQQAGNSPTMLHRDYKGLATRKEGEAWFVVAPEHPGNVVQLPKEAKAV
jgi:integrase